MPEYQCLVVDDEPIAREILLNYCQHLPSLKVLGACANALEAREVLKTGAVDILFLDINMPVMDGLSLLKTLRHQPQVIFTTAYKEYAVDAFNLAACDYLLKPFSFERFIMSIDKAIAQLQPLPAFTTTLESPAPGYIFIKADGRIYNILLNELLYAEASGNYTKLVMRQQTLLTGISFSAFEKMVPAAEFIRVHRSFIINKCQIGHIEGNRVFIQQVEIPIGSNYKESFLKQLGMGE